MKKITILLPSLIFMVTSCDYEGFLNVDNTMFSDNILDGYEINGEVRPLAPILESDDELIKEHNWIIDKNIFVKEDYVKQIQFAEIFNGDDYKIMFMSLEKDETDTYVPTLIDYFDLSESIVDILTKKTFISVVMTDTTQALYYSEYSNGGRNCKYIDLSDNSSNVADGMKMCHDFGN